MSAPASSPRRAVHERFPFGRATVVVVVLTAGLTAIVLPDARTWFLIPMIATMGWLGWVAWVWPRVVIEPASVRVRNAFTSCDIPFSAIDSVRGGLALQIRTTSGARVNAFGVHGRTGMTRDAIRTAHAHAQSIVPVRRVDDLRPQAATTQASQVAQIIMHKVEATTARPGERPRRRLNFGILAVTAGLAAATAAALVTTFA